MTENIFEEILKGTSLEGAKLKSVSKEVIYKKEIKELTK